MDQLKQLVADAEIQHNKLDRGTKSAAPKLRKILQQIKNQAQLLRVEALARSKASSNELPPEPPKLERQTADSNPPSEDEPPAKPKPKPKAKAAKPKSSK